MKNLKKALFTALLPFMGVLGVNAQNQIVLSDKNGSQQIITYNDNTKAQQLDEQTISFITKSKVKPQEKSTSNTYTLNVYPPNDNPWQDIFVSDGIGLIAELSYGEEEDYLSIELEEGIYHVYSKGYIVNGSEYYFAEWQKNDIELFDNTDVHIDFNECIYDVNLDFVDENGNSFEDLDFIDVTWQISVDWLPTESFCILDSGYDIVLDTAYHSKVPRVRYNSFDESHAILSLVCSFYTIDQESYVYCFSQRGLYESPTFIVSADELFVYREKFTIKNNNSDISYFYTNWHEITAANGRGGSYEGFSSRLLFDPEKPFTIISNAVIDSFDDIETNAKFFLLPTVYESINHDHYLPKYNDNISNAFYFDGKNNVVREAAPYFYEHTNRMTLYMITQPMFIAPSPAMIVQPITKLTHFGERTPLAVYHPLAYNANNTPLNQTFFRGTFHFSGELSSVRTSDSDSFIHVYVNGNEVYNDSIYKFNYEYNNSFQLDPAVVVVEVNNEHLFANDVQKSNYTRVEFDLEKEDAMPPTMTFLRVLDNNGDESIYLNSLNQSVLVFACADYYYHFVNDEWGGHYHQIIYKSKPEVEVLYSIDNEEWIHLEITEDENLFFQDYGNVFIANLSQIENRALDKWVNLKFVLTDEVGNSQTQELSNLFYAGENVSVNEHTAESLKHTVYPNPFTSEVKITAAQAVEGEANIAVCNILGEQVYSKTENCTATKEFTINGSAWKAGVYFYRISTEKGLLQGKIVKE